MSDPPKPDVRPNPDDAAPEYEFHELAALFPMISTDELNELAEDIKKHRLLERITLFEGKILDGRNRYKAAKQAGVVLKNYDFKQLDNGSAEAFVIGPHRTSVSEVRHDQPENLKRQKRSPSRASD
jgi:hypothetical protein